MKPFLHNRFIIICYSSIFFHILNEELCAAEIQQLCPSSGHRAHVSLSSPVPHKAVAISHEAVCLLSSLLISAADVSKDIASGDPHWNKGPCTRGLAAAHQQTYWRTSAWTSNGLSMLPEALWWLRVGGQLEDCNAHFGSVPPYIFFFCPWIVVNNQDSSLTSLLLPPCLLPSQREHAPNHLPDGNHSMQGVMETLHFPLIVK